MRRRRVALIALMLLVAVIAGIGAWATSPAMAGESVPPAGGAVVTASVTGLTGELAGMANGGANPVNVLTTGAGSVAGVALGVFASGVLGGAGSALRETARVISHTTAPRLRSTWFSSTYWRVAGLAALLSLPFLFAAAAQALLRADPALLGRSVFGYLPLALIGVNLAAPITMLLLAATDEMCSVVAGAGMGGGVHFLQQTAQEIVGLSALDGSPFLAIAIGLLTLAAAVALAVEMLIREAAVYVVVLMLPLALAALIWPARRIWAVRLLELLVALILSKFVIVAVLSLAGAAYGAGGSPTVTRLLTAMTLVLLSTFAPWVMLRLLPFTELAAGAAGGIRGELPRLTRAGMDAAAAASGVITAAESLPHLLRRQAGEPGSEEAPASSPGFDGAKASPVERLSPGPEPDRGEAGAGRVVEPGAGSRAGSGASAEAGAGAGRALGTTAAGRPGTATGEPEQRLPGMEPRWQAEDFTWDEIVLDLDGVIDADQAQSRFSHLSEDEPVDQPRAAPEPLDRPPQPPGPGESR